MIRLERHIEILLLTNDCVIIPNFGGFMAHHLAAHFDEQDHSYLPPTRSIGFNPLLKINDSLLAQSYVEAYDISYPEALRQIEQETEEIKQLLGEGGSYEMKDLGTLNVNSEGHYAFEPCEAGLLTPTLYGLSSFELKRLNVGESEVPARLELTSVQSSSVSTVEPDISEETLSEENTYTIQRSVVRNIMVACIALLAFLLLPSSLENGGELARTGSGIDTGLLTRIMPKDVTLGNATAYIAKEVSSKKEEAPHQIDNTERQKVDTKRIEPTDYYSIVLASRITHKNARQFVKRLHGMGYDAARIMKRNNQIKVIYGVYASENDARKVVNKFYKHTEFTDCWVTRVR